MRVWYHYKELEFKRPSGTSRGVLRRKPTYFLILEQEGLFGIGECSTLAGLSLDDRPGYEEKLQELADGINEGASPEVFMSMLVDWPSIKFGLEMAMLDLENGGRRTIYKSHFSKGKKGIPINGLIWMGEPAYMKEQVKDLLERGFTCLKMKIGAIGFDEEMQILRAIRKEYSAADLILRVDANGAFSPAGALEKLKKLSELNLHSIEQPIMAGQVEEMARLTASTPLDIALDEELIGADPAILDKIQPQYIILKPSLIGGFAASQVWIDAARKLDIGWWATSALESNIGLNAISQWTYVQEAPGHQGLGTGSLYTNNIASPLEIVGEKIFYKNDVNWDLDELF